MGSPGDKAGMRATVDDFELFIPFYPIYFVSEYFTLRFRCRNAYCEAPFEHPND